MRRVWFAGRGGKQSYEKFDLLERRDQTKEGSPLKGRKGRGETSIALPFLKRHSWMEREGKGAEEQGKKRHEFPRRRGKGGVGP